MEYAQNTQLAPRPTPELGRLKAAAERVAVARTKLENFIDRFHGGSELAGSAGPTGECADNYRNDLSSLFTQIERLELSVSSLDSIG